MLQACVSCKLNRNWCHHFTAWQAGTKSAEYWCPQICHAGYYKKQLILCPHCQFRLQFYMMENWEVFSNFIVTLPTFNSTLLYFPRKMHSVSILLATKSSVYILKNKQYNNTLSFSVMTYDLQYIKGVTRTNSWVVAWFPLFTSWFKIDKDQHTIKALTATLDWMTQSITKDRRIHN